MIGYGHNRRRRVRVGAATHHRGRHTILFIAIAVVGLTLTVQRPAATAAVQGLPTESPASRGISTRVGLPAARPADLRTVTLYSRALCATTSVYVLLPDSYATSTRQRYPVLYLLNGNLGTYQEWTKDTDVVSFARHYPVIVVMPTGGSYWYTNPASGTCGRWEDFHIHELIPYIDAHFRTIASRAGRAIAGLSSGGFGAFEYAARHPDLFAFAASFSGYLDLDLLHGPSYQGLVAFGNPATNALYWAGHNPVDLAPNLRGVQLYLANGNGQPGPFDQPHRAPDSYEIATHKAFLNMIAALRRAGVPATVEYYGNGTHTWLYFQRDLHHAYPLMLRTFAHPSAPPAPWSYRTTEDRFTVWGYSVVRTGAAPDWTYLQGVSRFGLTAAGSGLLTVTTAQLYRPGALYTISISGTRREVRADATGHLSLQITLGGPQAPRQVGIVAAATGR